MDALEEKLEIDRFNHQKKIKLILIMIGYELTFLAGLVLSFLLLLNEWPYAALFIASSLMHLIFWPYLMNRFFGMLFSLANYCFHYRAKAKFLIYEIIIVVVIELLFWALSAVFAPAQAVIYYLSLPFLCGLVIAFVIERHMMKELLLQIKSSKRHLVYYTEENGNNSNLN